MAQDTFDALAEIKKEKIKQQLDKAFESFLDKGADATVEEMTKKFHSMIMPQLSE